MKWRTARTVLFLACLAWAGAAAAAVRAEPAHTEEAANKRAHPDAHAPAPAHAHAHAHGRPHAHHVAHEPARKPAQKIAHRPEPELAHKPAHKPARSPAHQLGSERVHTPARRPAYGLAHKVARPTLLAPAAAASPLASRAEPRPARAAADPGGQGFLDLYAELCVKRIDDIDTFRDKLLHKKVPRLQPDSAKRYLAGVPGDAWPVPYHGKVGNFVLVLAESRNLCTLYARRTDTAAVEQGFAEMVAKPPPPMLAGRRPRTIDAEDGMTRTMSMNWAPPGGQRKVRFVLTTSSAPGARVQAYASVELVSSLAAGPGPDAAGGGNLTRPSSGSAAPAHRLRARP